MKTEMARSSKNMKPVIKKLQMGEVLGKNYTDSKLLSRMTELQKRSEERLGKAA